MCQNIGIESMGLFRNGLALGDTDCVRSCRYSSVISGFVAHRWCDQQKPHLTVPRRGVPRYLSSNRWQVEQGCRWHPLSKGRIVRPMLRLPLIAALLGTRKCTFNSRTGLSPTGSQDTGPCRTGEVQIKLELKFGNGSPLRNGSRHFRIRIETLSTKSVGTASHCAWRDRKSQRWPQCRRTMRDYSFSVDF